MSELKQRLAKGQEQAFIELYDQFGERLFAYVASRVSDRESAKDIVQNVFARLIRYHRHFRRVENIQAYLFQVCRNEIARWASSKPSPSSDMNFDLISADIVGNDFEERDWIDSMLSTLSKDDREIVKLKLLSGLTFAELESVLEMPAATIATRYRRAIAKLEASQKKKVTEDNG